MHQDWVCHHTCHGDRRSPTIISTRRHNALITGITLVLMGLMVTVTDGSTDQPESYFYTIQIASFQQHQLAVDAAKKLKHRDQDVFYRSKQVAGKGTWYRLYINRYATLEAAKDGVEQLRRQGVISDAYIRRLKRVASQTSIPNVAIKQTIPAQKNTKKPDITTQHGTQQAQLTTGALSSGELKKKPDPVTIKKISYRLDPERGDSVHIHADRAFWPALLWEHQRDTPVVQVAVKNIKKIEKDFSAVSAKGEYIRASKIEFNRREETLVLNLQLSASKSYTLTQFFNMDENVFSIALTAKQ